MQVLITGGAGFIGINAALFYLKSGHKVTILDNFSREGSTDNIKWLLKYSNNKPKIITADIGKDFELLKRVVRKKDFILHLAGQVAVTNSVLNPRIDFQSNILGTFNILEAIRLNNYNPVLIYSSTNKVYGQLENIKVREKRTRYEFVNLPYGVNESQNVDFYTPYGCSKGAADQYVRDYSRIYGLNTIVFRQSCIYGPRQFGVEDQGWLAWFIIALIRNKKITIYGNGKQVRDVLYVEDLIKAYDLAFKNIKNTNGRIYNIGGGIKNTISVWHEFGPLLEKLFQKKITVTLAKTRRGDQPIYISDIRKAADDFGWKPAIGYNQGIEQLYSWISENKEIFKNN